MKFLVLRNLESIRGRQNKSQTFINNKKKNEGINEGDQDCGGVDVLKGVVGAILIGTGRV